MAEAGTARVLVVTDLLLGAVYADGSKADAEIAEVRKILSELTGKNPLPAVFEQRIAQFAPARFDVSKAAAEFKKDEAVARRRLLELVASVRDADDEIDLAEDDYIRSLAAALDVPAAELEDLSLDYEIEDLAGALHLRSVPPASPRG